MAKPSPRHQRAQQRLARQLGEIGFALPGSITERYMRCGKPTCRCADDPDKLHGPYLQWTRKHDGKTITKLLTPEQAATYKPWIENAHRLRQLITQLETLTLDTLNPDTK